MRRTVALIDPHVRFRARATALLEGRGLRVLAAASGDEATSMLAGATPDLLLVDERLPEGQGLTWIRDARDRGIDAPAVLVLRPSAVGQPATALLDEHQVRRVLRKPVDDDTLLGVVDALLPGVGEPLGARTDPAPPPPMTLERASSRPPPPPPSSRKRTISEMRASYAETLPLRLAELADALDEAQRAPDVAHVFGSAKVLAHRLRGTAGAFGYVAVGDAAGRIEDALPAVLDTEEPRREQAWSTVTRALEEAIRAASPAPARAADDDGRTSEGKMLAALPSSETKLLAHPPAPTNAVAKVLVVDDDPAFLELVVELGRRKLVQVLTAARMSEAIDVARDAAPDAAIVDIHLGPSEHSFALARELRALPGCSAMPVAFISAATDLRSRIEAAAAGASLYLTKPIDAVAFDAAIQQLLTVRDREARRVVVLHDDDAARDAIVASLGERGFHTRSVRDASTLLNVLDEEKPDALVIGEPLAHVRGTDVCRAIRTSPRWQDLLVVVASRRDDTVLRRAAYESGADDVVATSLDGDELVARLAPRIDRARVGRERAGRDPLTSLLLRGAFLDQIGVRLSEAARHHRPISVCLLDLDHFKQVNDRHGHLAGDQVLVALGKLLWARFRAEDLRGRWGGEEFIVAFPGESAGNSYLLFTRILDEFSRIAFTGGSGETFHATFSAGIATFPEDGADMEALVQVADRRLYAAKRRGRKRVVIRA